MMSPQSQFPHTHLPGRKHLSPLGVILRNTLYKPQPTYFPQGSLLDTPIWAIPKGKHVLVR